MKKITKRILIASAVTAGTGVVFMGVGIALGGWPGVVFTKGGIHSLDGNYGKPKCELTNGKLSIAQ